MPFSFPFAVLRTFIFVQSCFSSALQYSSTLNDGLSGFTVSAVFPRPAAF